MVLYEIANVAIVFPRPVLPGYRSLESCLPALHKLRGLHLVKENNKNVLRVYSHATSSARLYFVTAVLCVKASFSMLK